MIYVEDGDTISIIAVMKPSVHDPACEIAGLAQSFRVVANSSGPIFHLVPLGNIPMRLTQLGMDSGDDRLLKGENF